MKKRKLFLLGIALLMNSISLIAAPNVDFTISSEGICVGQSITFTDISDGPPTKWQWTFAGGTPSASTLQNPTITYNNSGVFSVTLTVEIPGEGSFSVVKTDIFKVFDFPNPAFSSTGSQCLVGNSFTFNPTASGNHQWTFAGGSPASSIANFPSGITFSALGSHLISHTVTDNGCSSSASATITVFPALTGGQVAQSSADCINGTGSFTVTQVSGGTSPFQYSSNGSTFTNNPVFSNKLPGNYSVTVKDSKGCVLFLGVIGVQNPNRPTSIAMSVTNTPCNQSLGRVLLGNVTGGTPTFSFSFNGSGFSTTTDYPSLSAGAYPLIVVDAKGCSLETVAIVNNTSGPTNLTAIVTNATCSDNNGSIQVSSITGGSSPFKYSIDNTNFQNSTLFTGLAPDHYFVSVKDNSNCLFTKAIDVNGGGPTSAVITVTGTACNTSNGRVNIGTVTGGVLPLSFSFNGSAFTTSTTYTGLPAGSYHLVIKDNNGCTLEKDVIVSNTSGPNNFDVTVSNETCGAGNGTISVANINGGSSPFKYSIDNTNFQTSNAFNNLSADNYIISVRDNSGCIFSKSVGLINLAPTDVALTVTNTACNTSNGRILIGAVQGGQPTFSFSFNGGVFNTLTNHPSLAAGIYTVVVKDANNCLLEKITAVNNIGGPDNFTMAVNNSTCTAQNGNISITAVSGGNSPMSYAINNGTFQTNNNFTNLEAGDYVVTVKDNSGCLLTKFTAIDDIAPTAVIITVTNTPCNLNIGAVNIGNVSGGIAPYSFSFDNGSFTTSTNFSDLAPGVYPIVVRDANNCTFSTVATVNSTSGPEGFNVTVGNNICLNNQGFIDVTSVTGGSPTFSYAIDNGTFSTSNSFINLGGGDHEVSVKDAAGCIFSRLIIVADVPGPSDFQFTKADGTCTLAVGSVTFGTVTGGTPPYTYFFDNNFMANQTVTTGIPAGATTHTLKVRDNNGCTITKTLTIIDKSGPSAINFTTFPTGCISLNNGRIQISSVTGGTPTYSFSLNGGAFQQATNTTFIASFFNLAKGVHTVTVKDANICQSSFTIHVDTVPRGPNGFTSTRVNPGCDAADGVINIASVSGGIAPFSYRLNGGNIPQSPIIYQSSNTFTGLIAASYGINIRDVNNCEIGMQITPNLSSDGGPSALTFSNQKASCGLANGVITVTAVTGGSAPYLFSFNSGSFTSSNTFTGVAANTLVSIKVLDANSCTFKTNSAVSATFAIQPPTITLQSGILQSSAPQGNQWVRNGFAIIGATSPTLNASTNAFYWTRVSLGSCPTVFSNTIEVTNAGGRLIHYTGKKEEQNESVIESTSLEVFPNPNEGEFDVILSSGSNANFTIKIFNALGALVFEDKLKDLNGTYVKHLQISELGKGFYHVIVQGNESILTKKIITY